MEENISKKDIIEMDFSTKFAWFRDIQLEIEQTIKEDDEESELIRFMNFFKLEDVYDLKQAILYGKTGIHVLYYLNDLVSEKTKNETVIIKNKNYDLETIWEDIEYRNIILNKVLYHFLLYKKDIRKIRF